MSIVSPRPLLLALVLASTATSAVIAPLRPAHADATDGDEKAAKKHYERGQKLFNLRKFSEAIAAFEAAFEAKPIPKILFNIGQAHRNLGEHEAAIFSFKRYLKLLPEAPNREQVEEVIAELEAKVEQADAARTTAETQESEPERLARPAGPSPERAPGTTPVYKQWWFWTGVALVGVAGGIGIWAATSGGRDAPDVTLGVLDPP